MNDATNWPEAFSSDTARLYRKRKIDAIGREQTPPDITPDGVWQYAHDPQATRDAKLGAALRRVLVLDTEKAGACGHVGHHLRWLGVYLRSGGDLLDALRHAWVTTGEIE